MATGTAGRIQTAFEIVGDIFGGVAGCARAATIGRGITAGIAALFGYFPDLVIHWLIAITHLERCLITAALAVGVVGHR